MGYQLLGNSGQAVKYNGHCLRVKITKLSYVYGIHIRNFANWHQLQFSSLHLGTLCFVGIFHSVCQMAALQLCELSHTLFGQQFC